VRVRRPLSTQPPMGAKEHIEISGVVLVSEADDEGETHGPHVDSCGSEGEKGPGLVLVFTPPQWGDLGCLSKIGPFGFWLLAFGPTGVVIDRPPGRSLI